MSARIWLISDTHFGHDNIYRFASFDGVTRVRPHWTCAADADLDMVQRWNATITPQDHVYHLGDVGWSPDLPALIQSLHGKKRLILGNHDREDVRAYREMGFQKVMGCHQFQRGLWFTHIPLHPNTLGPTGLNVHGHIHERPAYGPQYRNVSVEQINYTPILLEQVLKESDNATAT
jgi:calcineurin-like phosphoesterase family protein